MCKPPSMLTHPVFVIALVWAGGLFPRAAEAHHTVSDFGISWAEPVTVFEATLELAEFDRDGERGRYLVTYPVIEYALSDAFSVTARTALVKVFVEGEADRFGLGDSEIGVKYGVYETKHGELLISAGLNLELPTGDADQALSSGHFELSPFVTLSTATASEFIVYAVFADRLSLEGSDDDGHGHHDHHDHHHEGASARHGSIIAPHGDHEAFVRLGVAQVMGLLFVSLGYDGLFVFDESEDLLGPQVARFELGYQVFTGGRFALGFAAPFAGPHRFEWRTRSGFSWQF